MLQESARCVYRQRDQLAARVKRLEELRTQVAVRNLSNMLYVEGLQKRVKELEEAMDAMDRELGNRAAQWRAWGEQLVRVGNQHIAPECDEWNKAKEAQP